MQMSETTQKVRVSARVQEFMSGGQVWQDLQYGGESRSGESPENVSMHRKVMQANDRKDGSCTVELSLGEAQSLYTYAGAMEAGASDNVGYDEYALPDLNASRALMRKLEQQFGREVWR